MSSGAARLKRAQGLTLIEVLTVVSIIMVLTTIATPFLGSLISKYQAESAGYHILATLKYCRVEALKRENNVSCTVSASEADSNVVTQVFVDINSNGTYEGTDTLLSSSTISNTSFLKVSPPDNAWTYNRQGATDNGGLEEIKLCSTTGDGDTRINSIFIDPLGVTYLKEAVPNENCS